MASLGSYLKAARTALDAETGNHSVRKVATRIDVSHAYLHKIETDRGSPPREKILLALAEDLNLEPNLLLALGGRVSSEVQAIFLKRLRLFAELLATCQDMPDNEILKIMEEARAGAR